MAIILVVLSSCTISHEIHFNDDWSGHFRYQLRGENLAVAGLDSTAEYGSLENLEEILEAEQGLSNLELKTDSTEGTLSISADFASLDVLNDLIALVMMTDSTGDSSDEPSFELSGRKLRYNLLVVDQSDDEETTEMLSSSIKFNLKLSFDKKVRKIKAQNGAILNKRENTIIWNTDMHKVQQGGKYTRIVVVMDK